MPFLFEPALRPTIAAMPTPVKTTPIGARHPPNPVPIGAPTALSQAAAVPGTMSNGCGADMWVVEAFFPIRSIIHTSSVQLPASLRPNLAQIGPTLHRVLPILVRLGPKSSEHGQLRSTFDQTRPNSARVWPEFNQVRSTAANSGPNRAIGHIRPSLANCRPSLAKLDAFRPTSGKPWPIQVEAGPDGG